MKYIITENGLRYLNMISENENKISITKKILSMLDTRIGLTAESLYKNLIQDKTLIVQPSQGDIILLINRLEELNYISGFDDTNIQGGVVIDNQN